MSSIRLFGVCVSVPSCETTHVLCGGGEHRLRVSQIHVSTCDLICLKQASPFGVACAPIFDGSRIGTALVSFTCAAMLRMQTLVSFTERYINPYVVDYPGLALDV